MKVYDSHSDIFYNLAFKNVEDPFKEYHLDDLTKGGVVGGIWVVYSDEDFDVVSAYIKAIDKFKKYENDFDVIKGLEGLRNVPDLETYRPYLEREFERYCIPYVIRGGQSLTTNSAGTVFSQINQCYNSDFSYDSVRQLLLNELIPWKENIKITKENLDKKTSFGAGNVDFG
jgi:hypothetical protein